MRRLLALATIIVVCLAVVSLAPPTASLRSTALALGFALIAAALAGDLLERVRLPRITGYLLFGLACGPYVANLITRPMARDLQVVNGLAVALIAFIAGLELDYRHLRPRLAALARLGGGLIGVLYALSFGAIYVAWPYLPIAPSEAGMERLTVAIVTTTILVSFSPAVTIAVIAESRARGPLTEAALAIVVLGDLALIFLFTLSMQLARWATGAGGAGETGVAVHLAWEIVGSLALGATVGGVFALYLRYVGREITVVLLGMCAFLGQLGAILQAEPLIAALAAGFVVKNVAPPEGEALRESVERGSLPVLIVFFAAAGASLQLDALARLGAPAVLLAVFRIGVIWVAARAGMRLSGLGGPAIRRLWTALVSQAGVVLGLSVIIAQEFPTWGRDLQVLVVAVVALNQFIGPAVFRRGLALAGEVEGNDR